MIRHPVQVAIATILLSLLAVNILNTVMDTLLYRSIRISERD